MIKLSGKVVIRTIEGRNGSFNVGRLITEIGEFAAKRGIEEFDPGTYEGDFAVSRIYPATYSAGGRSIVEVRADIDSIALIDVDTNPAEPEPPLEEEQEAASELQTDGGSPDEALFGELWPLSSEPFKLDPTIDRAVLRRQAARLKELGYKFHPVGRYWVQPE
jgi:hypothetical protein